MAILVALGLTGCVKTPKLENGAEVVAEIDGKQFSANELYDELRTQYGIDTLVNMIDDYIISQELEDTSSEEAQAKAYVKQMKEYYEAAGQNWNEVLTSYGYTEDSLTKSYLSNYAKESVARKYYQDAVTAEEIQKYYDEEIIGDVTAKHILITPEANDSMSDTEKAAAKTAAYNKAMEVINKLNAGGNFSELAKEYSDDKSSSEGGTLAPFNKQSNYAKEFIDASIKLNAGEYTKTPVETEYGYHIILVETKAEKPSLDDVKSNIIEAIAKEAINSNETYVYTAWKNLRSKYNIKIYDTIMEEKYNTAMTRY